MALTHDKALHESSEIVGDRSDLKVYGSIADTLRLARQEHGQDLRTVAQVLRIRFAYLEAIEAGDFDKLPGVAYALGFLRTYAEFLGLDGDEIVERFKHESQGSEPKLDLVFPEPVGQNRIPGGAIILISALLLGVAYGGWFYLSSEGKSVADLIPPLPERLEAMLASEDSGAGMAAPTEFAPAETTPAGAGSEAAAEAAPRETPPAYTPPETAETEAGSAPPLAGPAEPPVTEAGANLASEALAQAGGAPVETIPETGPLAGAPTASAEAVPAAEAPPAEPVVAGLAAAAEEAPAAPSEPAPAAPAPAQTAPTQAAAAQTAPAQAQAIQEAPTQTATLTASAPRAPAQAAPAPPPAPATTIEPLLDETVVIPSPPTSSQTMSLSTTRSPRIYGESTEGTRIVLRAVQDSWVQVRDDQDALLLTRVLRAGDTYYVPQQPGLTLLTGNAGGIEIEVDGVAVPPLGPIGAVRRQIALDPARLLDGTAQPR